MIKTVTESPPRKPLGKAKRRTFTELSLRKLKVPKVGQTLYWDSGTKGQLGLSVLLSAGGVKTFRSTFRLHGQRIDRKLGRVGEMDLAKARDLTKEDRKLAADGTDPRKPSKDNTLEFGHQQVHRALRQATAAYLGPDRTGVEEQLQVPAQEADGQDQQAGGARTAARIHR